MDKLRERHGVIESGYRLWNQETEREKEEEHRKRKDERASEEQGVTPGLATLL